MSSGGGEVEKLSRGHHLQLDNCKGVVKRKCLLFLTAVKKRGKRTSNKTEVERNQIAKRIYLMYEGAVAESRLHQSAWPIDEMKTLCAELIN